MSFVVFSGLPGSGKSTIAREVAPRLRLPLLDKDDFLDALFEERGVGDAAWRASLSREADLRLAAAARASAGACLVSWWQQPAINPDTGTPTAWLAELPRPVVEVHCRCPVETAVERFVVRRRHAGHLDALRSRASLRDQLTAFAEAGPLRLGPVIELDTEYPIAIAPLVTLIERAGLESR